MAKDGSKLATGPVLKGASGTAYYDGKLYAFEQAIRRMPIPSASMIWQAVSV